MKRYCDICQKEVDSHGWKIKDIEGKKNAKICAKHFTPTRGRSLSGIDYHDGGRTKNISKAMLKEIQSGVRTHEGQYLSGQAGRDYMNKHSKEKLGKDLSGSYNETRL